MLPNVRSMDHGSRSPQARCRWLGHAKPDRMMRVAVALLVIVVAMLLRLWPRCPDLLHWGVSAPDSLKTTTIICTASAAGADMPSAPITFAARFGTKRFATASAPLSPYEPPPPPQTGTYKYIRGAQRSRASLHLFQPEQAVHSVLQLTFTHAQGGVMRGVIEQGDEIVAEQCGAFHVCPDADA